MCLQSLRKIGTSLESGSAEEALTARKKCMIIPKADALGKLCVRWARWEREREWERERGKVRRKWLHQKSAEVGEEFTLSPYLKVALLRLIQMVTIVDLWITPPLPKRSHFCSVPLLWHATTSDRRTEEKGLNVRLNSRSSRRKKESNYYKKLLRFVLGHRRTIFATHVLRSLGPPWGYFSHLWS